MSHDDWEKPRRTSDHFTGVEVQILRTAFTSGTPAQDVARELKCSSRVVYKWFSVFRGDGHAPVRRRAVRRTAEKPEPVKKPLPSRFYHSNFELEP